MEDETQFRTTKPSFTNFHEIHDMDLQEGSGVDWFEEESCYDTPEHIGHFALRIHIGIHGTVCISLPTMASVGFLYTAQTRSTNVSNYILINS